MKLNLGLIGELLVGKYQYLICDPADKPDYTCVYPYVVGTEVEDDTALYLLFWGELQAADFPMKTVICIGGGLNAKQYMESHGIQGFVFSEQASPLSVLCDFQEIFSHYSKLEVNLLHAIASDAPTRVLLNCLAEFLRANVMLFNNLFELIEYSGTYFPIGSKIWEESIEHRRSAVPKNTVNNLVRRESASEDHPASTFHRIEGVPPSCKAVLDAEGFSFAHIIFMQVDLVLSLNWNWLVDYICDLVKPVLSSRYYTRFDSRYRLRSELQIALLGQTTDNVAFNRILRKWGWEEHDSYRVLLIRLRKRNSMVARYLQNYEHIFIEQFADAVALSCEGVIAIVLHNDACTIRDTVLEALENQLTLDDGFCSVGVMFCNVQDLHKHYLYAAVPMNHYVENQRILYFRDSLPKFVIGKLDSVLPVDSILHWSAIRVYEYDCEHGTNFLHTLEVYLLCNKSLNDAAEMLYIHKSTMYYRVKCLEKVAGIDFNDPAQRLGVLLSCIAIRVLNQLKDERYNFKLSE